MIISELQNNILKNKKPLMGLAICLIMWFHSIYDVQNAALALVKNMCDIGVDMFMFLSGFSMAYSFQKNSNVRQFYRKRLIRILPAYFLVFIFVYLYRDMIKGNGDILDVLYDLFFLNFFIDTSLIIWFIPVILLYYAITPCYIMYMKKFPFIGYLPYFIILVLSICIIFHIHIIKPFLWLRLPIFLIGINLFFVKDRNVGVINKIAIKFIMLLSILLALSCCYYCINIDVGIWALKFMAYIPLTMAIVYAYKSNALFNYVLGFLGGITLEIYLLHERIQRLTDDYITNQTLLCSVSIILAIISAYLVHIFINRLLCRLR